MKCIRCLGPLDVVAKCAGSVICSACAFEQGEMRDGEQPKEKAA